MGRTAGAISSWRKQYVPLRWMDDALCRQTDSELFFPEPGKAGAFRKAVAICHACPVITDCAEWAIADSSLGGVLGGLSDRERMAIRKQRKGANDEC